MERTVTVQKSTAKISSRTVSHMEHTVTNLGPTHLPLLHTEPPCPTPFRGMADGIGRASKQLNK